MEEPHDPQPRCLAQASNEDRRPHLPDPREPARDLRQPYMAPVAALKRRPCMGSVAAQDPAQRLAAAIVRVRAALLIVITRRASDNRVDRRQPFTNSLWAKRDEKEVGYENWFVRGRFSGVSS